MYEQHDTAGGVRRSEEECGVAIYEPVGSDQGSPRKPGSLVPRVHEYGINILKSQETKTSENFVQHSTENT